MEEMELNIKLLICFASNLFSLASYPYDDRHRMYRFPLITGLRA